MLFLRRKSEKRRGLYPTDNIFEVIQISLKNCVFCKNSCNVGEYKGRICENRRCFGD